MSSCSEKEVGEEGLRLEVIPAAAVLSRILPIPIKHATDADEIIYGNPGGSKGIMDVIERMGGGAKDTSRSGSRAMM